MEQSTNTNTTNSYANRKWMFILGIICLGIFIYGYVYPNTTSNFSFLFGENLTYGFFIWGIFHMILGKKLKLDRTKAFYSFLFIFGSLIASDFISYSQQKLASKQMFTEIQKDFSTINSSTTDAQSVPQLIEKPLETTLAAKGELGEMERFIKRFIKTLMNQIVSLRNDYLLEINAIGWEKILDPSRLNEDSTLIESKTMIQKAKDILEKYRAKHHALLKGLRKDINNLNISESAKKQATNGFDASMTESGTKIDASWDLEEKTLKEFENIITLLSAKKEVWVIQNNQILFANDDDLNAFNSYIASIQDLANKAEILQKQNVQKINNDLDNLINQPNL